MPLSEEPAEPRAAPVTETRAPAGAGADGSSSDDGAGDDEGREAGDGPDGSGTALRADPSARAVGEPLSGASPTPTEPVAMSRMSIASFARSRVPAFVSSPSSPFVAPPDPVGDDGADVAETGGADESGETGETDAAESDATQAASEPVVFACEGGPSCVRLRIDAGERAVRSDLGLALVAADAEAAIGGIERWFDVPLDLSPVRDGDSAAVADVVVVRATLAPRTPGSLPATLQLPPAALATLPPLPRALELSLRMRFEPLRTRCRVARIALPAAQAARLLPGAVLLLPESFGEGVWTVRLEVGDEVLAATLDIPAAALVVVAGTAFAGATANRDIADGVAKDGQGDAAKAEPQAEREEGATVQIDIVLERPVELDPRALLGGGGASVDLPAQLPYCGFRCLVDGVPRLDGHVAPLGDGHAFFALESIG